MSSFSFANNDNDYKVHSTARKNNNNNKTQDDGDPRDALSNELSAMSMQEQAKVFEDVHGSFQVIDETPEFIDECFEKFFSTLNNKIHFKHAFDLALSMSREYVLDPKLILMFLRSTSFNAPKAAYNFVTFWEEKKKLFGADKLVKNIQLSDLTPAEIKSIKSGWVQLLPFRDSAGRAVLWVITVTDAELTPEVRLRQSFYQYMVALEDEETQKRGVVMVSYGEEPLEHASDIKDVYWRGARFIEFMPIRFVCVHCCIRLTFIGSLISLFMSGVGKEIRARVRFHTGTDVDWQYRLMTFGIPVQHAPVSYTGSIKVKNFLQWLQRRELFEQQQQHPYATQSQIQATAKLYIDLPGRYNILLGKGAPFQQHTGNLRFHHIVDQRKKEYSESTKMNRKKEIIQEIITKIHAIDTIDEPTAFLEKDKDGWWTEVTSKDLPTRKISNRLRVTHIPATQPNPIDDASKVSLFLGESNNNSNASKAACLNRCGGRTGDGGGDGNNRSGKRTKFHNNSNNLL